jgi:hypothetical protein
MLILASPYYAVRNTAVNDGRNQDERRTDFNQQRGIML